MKIALLTDGIFPFVVGGMQKHSYYLAQYLARAGVYVDVYYAAPECEKHDVNGMHLYSDAESRFIRMIRIERPALFRFPGHYIWESYLVASRIWDRLKNELDIDFIYAQGFAGWKVVSVKQKNANLPPVGVNFHGFEMWQRPAGLRARLEHWLLRPFVALNIRKADSVLLLGSKLRRLVERAVAKPIQYMESSNGVTANWVTPVVKRKEGPMRFVFLGRYERRKGIEELHDVIRALESEYDFQFDMIGPLPDHVKIKSLRVQYWGLLKAEDHVRTILQRSDVIVCPSYAEGMPTVILEAMASGMAVIATDVGAVGDMVSEKNGWLVPAGNVVALRQAITDALTLDSSRLLEKKQASVKLVEENYLWEMVTAKTIQNIETVLQCK